MTGPPVLVVDDDAGLTEVITTILADEGYAVEAVTSTQEAVQLFATRGPAACCLVLSDSFVRPRTDPYAWLDLLRTHTVAPIVIVSGIEAHVYADHCARGFAAVLPKPFDLDSLLLCVATVLARPLDPVQERQAQVVQQYFAALTARDWDALLALCTEDITYVLPRPAPFAGTVQGKAAFRAYTDETYRHFPAARFTEIQTHALPHGLVARYQGVWSAPDGTELQQEGAVVFAFAGTLIAQIGVELDAAHLSALLGH